MSRLLFWAENQILDIFQCGLTAKFLTKLTTRKQQTSKSFIWSHELIDCLGFCMICHRVFSAFPCFADKSSEKNRLTSFTRKSRFSGNVFSFSDFYCFVISQSEVNRALTFLLLTLIKVQCWFSQFIRFSWHELKCQPTLFFLLLQFSRNFFMHQRRRSTHTTFPLYRQWKSLPLSFNYRSRYVEAKVSWGKCTKIVIYWGLIKVLLMIYRRALICLATDLKFAKRLRRDCLMHGSRFLWLPFLFAISETEFSRGKVFLQLKHCTCVFFLYTLNRSSYLFRFSSFNHH